MEFSTYQNLVFIGGFLIVFLLMTLIGEFIWGDWK